MAYLMFKMLLSSMGKIHYWALLSFVLWWSASGHRSCLGIWAGQLVWWVSVRVCVWEREMGGSCGMCETGGQMGRSRQEKVLGTEWRMISDKRLSGWLNKQWRQTIWWITMALWWTTHGLRGKQTGCVAGTWSAGLLSQQYLDKDGAAIRVNVPFVWPYGQILVKCEVL